jgi:hypothetical protein
MDLTAGLVRVAQKDPFFGRLQGSTSELARRLNKHLGRPQKTTAPTRELGGVVFYKERNHTHQIWSFRIDDMARVAAILNTMADDCSFQKVQSGDIVVSDENTGEFTRFHQNPRTLYAEMIAALGDPRVETHETRPYRGITFSIRWNGTWKVWTFPAAEINKLGAALGLRVDEKLLMRVQPDEVRVVFGSTELKRFHDRNLHPVDRLHDLLGKPELETVEQRPLEGVIFTRRRGGNKRIWTFKKSDLERVGTLLGVGVNTEALSPVRPNEIYASTSCRQFFRLHGRTIDLVQRLKDEIGDPVKMTADPPTYQGVCFYRRNNRTKSVLAFAVADLDNVGRILGVKVDAVLLLDVQADEVIVTHRDTTFTRLKGEAWRLAQALNHQLGSPDTTEADTQLFHGLTFTRRISGAHKIWTFKRTELVRLEQILTQVGIINPHNYYCWCQGVDLPAATSTEIEASKIEFDSQAERIIGLLLLRYGLLKRFAPGVNMQVKAIGDGSHTYDYVLTVDAGGNRKQLIVEHHPDFIEAKTNANKVRLDLERLLGRLDETTAQALRDHLAGKQAVPVGSRAERILARQIFGAPLDVYDVRRLVLIELNQEMNDHVYLRTRKINQLFAAVFWPLYYQPRGEMDKVLALRDFRRHLIAVHQQARAHDEIVLPALFGQVKVA